MNKIYNHSLLDGLSQTEKKVIWHLYKAKYPDLRWTVTYFALLSSLISLSLITTLILGQYIGDPLTRLSVCSIIFISVGVVGSLMIVEKILRPRRIRDFHEYLNAKDLDEVIFDLKETTSNLS